MELTTKGKILAFSVALILLIIAVIFVWWRKKANEREAFRRTILLNETDLDIITDSELAAFACRIYEKDGFSSKQLTGDLTGAHYMLVDKNDMQYVVCGISVPKGYSVGRESVQLAISTQAYYAAQGLIVVTNRIFSNEARRFISRTNIRAIERQELANFCLSNHLENERRLLDIANMRCPLCGNKTTKIISGGVAVYRCKAFPACHGANKE